MNESNFVTAINCMDGRVQIPVIEYLKDTCSAKYVDMITEPGPNKIIAERKDDTILDSIRKRVEISITRHASKLVAIVGHHDCAGNPGEKKIQLEHITAAIKTVKSWDFDVKLVGLWVDENWKVCELK
ncbi:MAG: hypothetical protein L6243_05045 [Candidatus Altiarchaeales archaeon]|nr:hypothetical protein [Candidatus Altiarchaeota archaeon]MBU4341892.1 hypothetical protein [Candidatus Altiarchaeota archaeon]MCG2782937.1 hypothetical protein [Candidatus Altiarchaeales archaeon]